jgi:SAM-dependent methyltransferase
MNRSATGEARHHHPAFAVMYAGFARVAERASLGRLRSRTLRDASGRVLLLGAGQGHDIPHLPHAVTEVVAVEPDPAMRRLGHRRVAESHVPAWYVAAAAEHLPLADRSVDTVVSTLVLCSVHDLDRAAAELRRVLKPDGRLLLLEHVRAANGSRLASAQDRADPVWERFSGGCHVNRRVREALEQAGFDTEGVRDRHIVRAVPLIDPGMQGVAVPR